MAIIFFMTFSITFNGLTSGKEEPNIGRIYGTTYQIIGWETFPTPFVIVQAGSQIDISDIFGFYELTNLPLDQVYELKANKIGYEEENFFVELTSEQPEVEVNIMMTLKGTSFTEFNQKYMQCLFNNNLYNIGP